MAAAPELRHRKRGLLCETSPRRRRRKWPPGIQTPRREAWPIRLPAGYSGIMPNSPKKDAVQFCGRGFEIITEFLPIDTERGNCDRFGVGALERFGSNQSIDYRRRPKKISESLRCIGMPGVFNETNGVWNQQHLGRERESFNRQTFALAVGDVV